MKLYVDDVRIIPEGWDYARNYSEAIVKLLTIEYDEISLDHDIASYDVNGKEMTGYDIVMWLATRKMLGQGHVPNIIHCHSANPVGRKNIESVVNRYLK